MYFDKEFSVSDRGAMIGDDCIIGSRATLQGGSILLGGATIGEGEFFFAEFLGFNMFCGVWLVILVFSQLRRLYWNH